MERPNFGSIKEVKEFISDPGNINAGVITIVDEKTGKSSTIKMNEFIEKVGLDNAAKIFYDKQGTIFEGNPEEELERIKNKILENPSLVTPEERVLLKELIKIKASYIHNITYDIMTLIIKSFLIYEKELPAVTKFNGMLSILLILLEGLTTLSSETLSIHAGNPTYNEIIRSVTEQISIPEGIDDDIIFISLLNIIGNRIASKKTGFGNKTIDFRKFAEVLELDTKYLFEENVLKE